jgi:hypothetical protein
VLALAERRRIFHVSCGHVRFLTREGCFYREVKPVGVRFKYGVGDSLFLSDALSKASRSVRRVIVRKLHGLGGQPRYWVVPVRAADADPVLVGEENLDPLPTAYALSAYDRTHWGKLRVEEGETGDGRESQGRSDVQAR